MVPFINQLFLDDLGYLVELGEVPISRIDDVFERLKSLFLPKCKFL